MKVRLLVIGSLVCAMTGCVTSRPEMAMRSLSGVDLYQRLCSSCHGVNGEGDGPVASQLKVNTPDLTRLAARDGGEFPTEDVRQIIDGRTDRRAHGLRDMPVWGWQLYDIASENDNEERARTSAMIDKLVVYLQSIQRP